MIVSTGYFLPLEFCEASHFGLSCVQYTFTVMMHVLWSDIEPDSVEMVKVREIMGMITQGILSMPINLPGFAFYKALKVIWFTPFSLICVPVIQHVLWLVIILHIRLSVLGKFLVHAGGQCGRFE